MSILIFIVILAALIIVHEFGHFIAAKIFKIRVDEFGVGYPPRALTLFEWRGTKFTLNWLPFGGFVKIFGENGEVNDGVQSESSQATGKSFVETKRPVQATVLVAGVLFNIIFAWLLISLGFMIGLPSSVDSAPSSAKVENARLVITSVSIDSPADSSGLKSGDSITTVQVGQSKVNDLVPEKVSNFISEHGSEEIEISYSRGGETGSVTVTPVSGIIEGRQAIGISMGRIGVLKLPIHLAFFEGAKTTVNLTYAVAIGLVDFIGDAVLGKSDLSQVTGPVGIVGLVGDASRLGFAYLVSFTAFISVNLAVINLIPFPALDGGRLLFVLIEAIKRKPIPLRVVNILNTVGFFVLIGLMILVTVHDVSNLF